MNFSKPLSALALGLTLSNPAFAGRKQPAPPPPPVVAPRPAPTPVPETNNDARFTFAKATQYFAYAKKPAASELIGAWVQVGVAASPNSRETGWYTPEGTLQSSLVNYPLGGFAYRINDYKFVAGAFGDSVLVVDRILKSQKNGQIVQNFGTQEVKVLTEGGVHVSLEDDTDRCARAVSCRLVTPSDLLCASVTTQNYQCSLPQGMTYAYTIFKRASVIVKRIEAAAAATPKASATPASKRMSVLK